MRTIHALIPNQPNRNGIEGCWNFYLLCNFWRCDTNAARRQCCSLLRTRYRTKCLRSGCIRQVPLRHHRFAARHIRHRVHAAMALTAKTERNSSERAGQEHEQKEQGCEAFLHRHRSLYWKVLNPVNLHPPPAAGQCSDQAIKESATNVPLFNWRIVIVSKCTCEKSL